MDLISYTDFVHTVLMLNNGTRRIVGCVLVLSPGKYIGGAERYVQNIAAAFPETCGMSTIIAISHNRQFYDECKRETGVLVVYLGNTFKDASLSLSRLLSDLRPRAVISNGYHSLYLVFFARCRLLFRGTRAIFIDIKHGWIETNLAERFKTFMDKLATFLCDCVVVVNQEMKEKLWFIHEKKKFFVPSGVGIRGAEVTHRQVENKFPFRVLLVGRLSEEKRFQLVLEALGEIKDDSWELVVVGDGPEFTRLVRTAVEKAIHDRVRFMGYQQDVDRFYRNSDLLIISSLSEGCPLVALEAMARGVLILSTKVGCVPLLLGERRGFLVDKGITPEKLVSNISWIMKLSDAEKDAIRERAFSYVEKHHNLKENANILCNLIKHGSNDCSLQ